ncbi:ankyrin [Neoconidiobolus thromboides FSU 785]|nr:ankyrin [Neoconidiobolus thromboides FSU 785]
MSHSHLNNKQCNCNTSSLSFQQSLDELEFDRSIHGACVFGDEKKINKMIQSSKNVVGLVNSVDSYGYAPLHYAAKHNHLSITKILLVNGANINAKTKGLKTTVLHRAILDKNKEMINFLLDNGADLDIVDDLGRTPRELLKQPSTI